MIKKVIILLSVFSAFLFTQTKEESEVISSAMDKFSKSPFSSIFVSGGVFYSGDDVTELPMMIDYFSKSSGNSQNMKAIDGLFGSVVFDAKINGDNLDIYIAQDSTNYKTTLNRFFSSEPIMRFPKVYSDALQYKFIDLSKPIVSTNIVLGKNWHTLEIGYRDRIDTIIFSATTMRVRTH